MANTENNEVTVGQAKKQLSVIESPPCQATGQIRKYMMLTQQERQDIKQANPELNVRLANERETLENLAIKDEAMQEGKEVSLDTELSDRERLRNYQQAMMIVEDLAYKFSIISNRELLIMPDWKILRWKW